MRQRERERKKHHRGRKRHKSFTRASREGERERERGRERQTASTLPRTEGVAGHTEVSLILVSISVFAVSRTRSVVPLRLRASRT